ncbi:hypothetical protein QBC47DRAFT_121634 [Echria macrotheca]|uniref:Uncharacterized protein n=1 Tax=Echria macrotheca TaxID=438768 RepID=A0AAJ0F0J8_9PEZI|nr:hypothetical protein QBC47DRAFT_121634 [Echria macrotheca]
MSHHYRDFTPDGILSEEQVGDPPDAPTASSTAYPVWPDSSLPLSNTVPGYNSGRLPFLCNDTSYLDHSLPISPWDMVSSRPPPGFSSPAADPYRADEADTIMGASLHVEMGSTPPSNSEWGCSATNGDWVKSPIADGERKEKEDFLLGNIPESRPSSSTSTTMATTLRAKKRRCASTNLDQAGRSFPSQFAPGPFLPSLSPPPLNHLEDGEETPVSPTDEESRAGDGYVHVPSFDGINWEPVEPPTAMKQH